MKAPRVTVHYAQSLDGRIATATGESQWIGSQESLELAHQLRASHNAVLVGIGTVLRDDPRLTVRLVKGPHPLRVVLDSTLRLPLRAALLADSPERTLVATTGRAAIERIHKVQGLGAEVAILPPDAAGTVSLAALLRTLAARGVQRALIEGGSRLITSAFREGLVDRLVVAIAPKIIGAGLDAVGDLRVARLGDAVHFSSASVRMLGETIIFEGEVARPAVAVPRRPRP